MKDLDRIERRLSQLSRKPAPSDLRETILMGAGARSTQRRTFSPALQLVASACLVLAVVASLLDAKLTQHQDMYLVDLLGIERDASSATRTPWEKSIYVDIFGGGQADHYISFFIKRSRKKERSWKRRDYRRLNDVLKRWENEI